MNQEQREQPRAKWPAEELPKYAELKSSRQMPPRPAAMEWTARGAHATALGESKRKRRKPHIASTNGSTCTCERMAWVHSHVRCP
eukprot:scaffold13896_cov120-Isochrysis_galbana.AAC.9